MRALVTATIVSALLVSACSKKKDDASTAPSATASTAAAAPEVAPPAPTPSATATASATPSATASAETAPDAAGATPDAPPLPLIPLRLVSNDAKATEQPLVMRADGSVLIGKDVVAKVVANRIEDTQGKTLIDVDRDGVVHLKGKTDIGKFDANDQLVATDGKMAVADDGSIILTDLRGKVDKAPSRFIGFQTRARRTALLLTTLLDAAPGDMQPRPGASANAAATPAPTTRPTTPTPGATQSPPQAPTQAVRPMGRPMRPMD